MLHRFRRGLRFGALLSLVGIVLSAIHAAVSSHTLGALARWIHPGFFQASIECAVSIGHATRAGGDGGFLLAGDGGQSVALAVVAGLVGSILVTALRRQGGPMAPAAEAPVGAMPLAD
jgi:hypothetical protein